MSARQRSAMVLAMLFALLALAGVAVSGPVLAVEEDELEVEEAPPPPDYEELCREGTIAEEYCPEPYEEPSWFQWLIYPLLIAGLVMATGMLVAYLIWQPRFAREREENKSRR